MTRPRILRQIFAHYETEIQWHFSGFIYRQLRFNHGGKLLANFVKLFKFEIRWQFAGDLFIAQRHLFVAHIQQTIGAGVGQCPWRIEVRLHRLAQALGKDAVFIHIDGGTDKLMHVAVVADPQIDSLLTPADNAVQLALQIEHQPVDELEIVMGKGRILDAQQVGLQLIPRRLQRILQLAQST